MGEPYKDEKLAGADIIPSQVPIYQAHPQGRCEIGPWFFPPWLLARIKLVSSGRESRRSIYELVFSV